MKKYLATLGIVSFLVAPQAVAQTATATTEASAPKKADEGGKKMICRTEDQIGSHLKKKRICMTRDEWRQVNVESNMALEKNTTQLAKPGGG